MRAPPLVLRAIATKVYTGVMLVATVFAQWGSDVYEVIAPPLRYDQGVYTCIMIVFILFALEFLIMSLCRDKYLFTFFFWLDLIAAISLLPDALYLFGISIEGGGSGSSLTVARAGRAARAGTRAARIVRVIKLITLVRKQGREQEERLESKIGGQLADLITQKVIVIVGAMLIATSLLDLISTSTTYTFESEMENLEIVAAYAAQNNDTAIFQSIFARFIVDHDNVGFPQPTYSQKLAAFTALTAPQTSQPNFNMSSNWLTGSACGGRTLRYLRLVNTDVWCSSSNANDLRSYPSEADTHMTAMGSYMILDQSAYARGQSLVNIVQVMFIVILLSISSALFNHDAETLVIRPLAKMAKLVHTISANPLAEIHESAQSTSEYETDFVESALKKFGKLLQVAFGEAGAEIIGANMSNGGELNLMMAGRKMDAIFGFVVIFHFSECTECLQEEIMTFVNQVAEYIHVAVAQNEGFTNKNIGEAWLLAWRMPEPLPQPFTKADSALKAFVRVALQTWHCPKLRTLTEHPKIQEKLPGYQISMGFGLHVGWAIQGAIGSPQKIDASFLSPNVNLASRLEAANHQFHTTILFSGQIYALLSPRVRELVRKVDRVTVKGSAQPLELWTYDVPFDRFESLEELRLSRSVDYWDKFAPSTSAEYRARYKVVIEHYLGGRWEEAKRGLDDCLQTNPEDGPAQALLEIMKKYRFKAPSNWEGYRELTEK